MPSFCTFAGIWSGIFAFTVSQNKINIFRQHNFQFEFKPSFYIYTTLEKARKHVESTHF